MLRLCGFRVGSSLRNSQLNPLHRYSSSSSSYSALNTTAGKMAFLGGYEKKHKVTIVGSGNWYVSGSIPASVFFKKKKKDSNGFYS